MRIACLIASLDAGGAERVMAKLAAFLAPRHEVLLLTLGDPRTQPFYSIPESVQLVQTGLQGRQGAARLWDLARRAHSLRRHLRQFRPDVVLSFMDTMNVVAISAAAGSGAAVVVSERVDPHHNQIGRAAVLARRLLYPHATRIVVQTARVAQYFSAPLQKRIVTIANPIDPSPARAAPAHPGPDGRFRIIGVGRLNRQKGFDLLVDAFALVAGKHPQWDLVIFGDGEERDALVAQAEVNRIADRIRFAGITRDTNAELTASHILAFPSRYEGFPNALAEGLAAGLPAIGFRDVSGVEELIVDGVTGLLVPAAGGPAALASALARLMADTAARTRMGLAATEHVEKWKPSIVLQAWEDLLTSVGAAERRPTHAVAEPASG